MSQGSPGVIEPLVQACQLTAGRALDWWEPPSTERLLEPFNTVPDPTTLADVILVRSILTEFVDRLGIQLHSSFHYHYQPGVRCCRFKIRAVDYAEFSTGTSAITLLIPWLARYRRDFDSVHETLAQRARRYLEGHATETLTIAQIEAALAVERRSLQRAFLSETGLHLKEYQVRLRVASALPLLWSGEKIEAVALLVGWRSKKDLYRATDRLIGCTPTGIRSMSVDAVARAVQELHSVNRRANGS